jgi:hypothetical protein
MQQQSQQYEAGRAPEIGEGSDDEADDDDSVDSVEADSDDIMRMVALINKETEEYKKREEAARAQEEATRAREKEEALRERAALMRARVPVTATEPRVQGGCTSTPMVVSYAGV